MNCPKCSSVMEQVEYAGSVVDRCTSCHGLWFDLLEHQDLKLVNGSEAIDIGDVERGKRFNEVRDVNCPKCQAKMVKMVDAGQPHIWYESCSLCHGVFFDAGEFSDFKKENIGDFFKWFKAKARG